MNLRFPFFLARSGLQAQVAHVGLFFRSFSLLFSYLVFVRFFVLFLSIFGPILGAKIDEISTKKYVIFLTVFWRFFSLFFFDFWCNVVNEG